VKVRPRLPSRRTVPKLTRDEVERQGSVSAFR
jgi:hypothetical protein